MSGAGGGILEDASQAVTNPGPGLTWGKGQCLVQALENIGRLKLFWNEKEASFSGPIAGPGAAGPN